jgi:asparagine synthase (glutamine-hydrolysing)
VTRVDAFMMTFSLEGRFPFLDHEVVEFAMRLPSRLKVRDGERKRIVRRVAARHVHPSCLDMAKKGFGLPLAQWMEGPLRPYVEEKLTALAKDGEIFRPEAVLAIRDRRARPAPTPRQVWHLVSTQLWREAFFGASSA